jgi:hypothetical protein
MENMLRNTLWTWGSYWEPIKNLEGTLWEHIGKQGKMEKKSFPSPKLKRNKSKAPWALPLVERKINPPQIKLAWKVHCPSGHGLSTLHTKYSLKKKTSPPTSHHPHPGRKLQCQTLIRGMVRRTGRMTDGWTEGWRFGWRTGRIQGRLPTSFNIYIIF